MRWEISTPITLLILYRSYSHASLTPSGLLTAGLTATIHALHPNPLPFTLLLIFFVFGTAATKVKKEVKATLTLSSTGSHVRRQSNSNALLNILGPGWNKTKEAHEKREIAATKSESTAGGQEPRSAIQVLANSGVVTLLCLVHVYIYGNEDQKNRNVLGQDACFGSGGARDVILAGIIANYAAVTADTLSSELGILSKTKPLSILNLRQVPPGTNGGVTSTGLFAGLAGALVIGAVSIVFLPSLCDFSTRNILNLVLAIGVWGMLGSVLDSVLGALLQASVVDRRTGKVVEAPNGGRVLFNPAQKEKVDEKDGISSKASRILGTGRDVLNNNQVNLLMAGIMSIGAMFLAYQGSVHP